MRLTSPDVDEGGPLATIHGYKFDNLSPGLAWSDVPSSAASLVLTLIDTHPVARGYVHWFVDGIPPVDGTFAPGTHEYVFTLFALDASAPALPAKTTVDAFLAGAADHILDQATLSTTFTKPLDAPARSVAPEPG